MAPPSSSRWTPSWLSTAALFSLSLSFLGVAAVDNQTSPTHIFRSRPDLHAPIITTEIYRKELVTPGYFFFAPYHNTDGGPYIYDNNGTLIWSGPGMLGPVTAHNPHVCNYKGEHHLCFFRGDQHQGFARGHGIIMDRNYKIVKSIEPGGSSITSDMHEFRLAPEGRSALLTTYQPRQYDLSEYGLSGGMGWIVDGGFQEVDLETGEVIFEWRSLDHVPPAFGYTCIRCTDTSGDGMTADTPWDYFHINSIDKNKDGDYLISARHTAAIYKISGVDGHIIWQLHGANPTFRNTNFRFSSQHHAIWRFENASHSVISLFDNGYNGYNRTSDWSRGMVVLIDHTDNTATQVRNWEAPEAEGGVSAKSQGNLQLLHNGNVVIGWGDHPYYSEHLDAGEPVLYAKIAFMGANIMNYRVNKYNWTGIPLSAPALWTYSRTGSDESGMQFYMSWNGATEVRSWNLYVADAATGPFELVRTTPKRGFETHYHFPGARPYAYVEAVDAQGRTLSRSAVTKTFVPGPELARSCDDAGCAPIPPLAEGQQIEHKVPYVPNRGLDYRTGLDSASYYVRAAGAGFAATVSGVNWKGGNAPVLLFVVIVTLAVTGVVYRRRASRAVGWFSRGQPYAKVGESSSSNMVV